MKLYIARHGQTEWNAKNLLCGRTDLPLNVIGEKQAEQLAERMICEGAQPDVIIASPMIRAMQTADIVAARLGVPVEIEPRLIEQHYGRFEGGSIREPEFLAIRQSFAIRYPGGESMLDVAGRVYPLLAELRERRDVRSALLISHGGTIRVMNTYFMDMSNEVFATWRMENAQLLQYDLP